LSKRSHNWFILLGIALATLVADRVSKTIITRNLTVNQSWHPPQPALKEVFSFTYTTNTGAAFGLFPNQGVLFVVIAFFVITAIIYYYRHLPAGYRMVRIALGLQLGGALGNLIDRLRQGYVVDFIDLNFWPMHNWPVFNVADSAVVIGVGLLALTMLNEDITDTDDLTESHESETAHEPGTSP
jgi:signal peptidase II